MSVTKWINARLGANLQESSLAEIKDFSLIWNIFEDSVCDNNFNITEVQKRIAERGFMEENFEEHLQYFKNRYITGDQTNERFEFLHFRANDRRDFVRQVLLGELTDIKEVLLAIIIIIYRFRNNLFHGLKNVQEIDQQQTNFQTANSFLMIFLDQIW